MIYEDFESSQRIVNKQYQDYYYKNHAVLKHNSDQSTNYLSTRQSSISISNACSSINNESSKNIQEFSKTKKFKEGVLSDYNEFLN